MCEPIKYWIKSDHASTTALRLNNCEIIFAKNQIILPDKAFWWFGLHSIHSYEPKSHSKHGCDVFWTLTYFSVCSHIKLCLCLNIVFVIIFIDFDTVFWYFCNMLYKQVHSHSHSQKYELRTTSAACMVQKTYLSAWSCIKLFLQIGDWHALFCVAFANVWISTCIRTTLAKIQTPNHICGMYESRNIPACMIVYQIVFANYF